MSLWVCYRNKSLTRGSYIETALYRSYLLIL